jgi:hypothetical protein
MHPGEAVKLSPATAANIKLLDQAARLGSLPTYSQPLAALNNLELACSGVSYMEREYAEELSGARALLEKFDQVS